MERMCAQLERVREILRRKREILIQHIVSELKGFYPHLRRSPMLLSHVGKGPPPPPHFSKTTEEYNTRVVHSEE